MLIYESSEKEGGLDIETLAYTGSEEGVNLILSQGLYRGPEVVSHSSIILKPVEYARIVTILSQIEIQKFLKDYKTE
tara:strand:- start:152 stop:382 length:231 start_codon:yes stop_codon:yes gene_type:complete